MPTCGEILANTLWDLGVRHVFGLPGGENVHVMEALRRRGIEFCLVRNESSAAYAAAACWRLTGRPQACLTTLGPGATHAMAGVGHLWLDRAPVVVITARTTEVSGPMHTHQVLDLTHLMTPHHQKIVCGDPRKRQAIARMPLHCWKMAGQAPSTYRFPTKLLPGRPNPLAQRSRVRHHQGMPK